jgi:hypothetical protein
MMSAADYRALNAPKKPANGPPRNAAPTSKGKTHPAPGASLLRKTPRHLEDDLQEACVKWFRMQYGPLACMLFAIPNGGQRNAREGARLKAQGVTAGVPDLLLAVVTSRAPGLFIELKVGKNKPSAAQEAHLKLLSIEGYETAVVYSLDAFRETVQAYLKHYNLFTSLPPNPPVKP